MSSSRLISLSHFSWGLNPLPNSTYSFLVAMEAGAALSFDRQSWAPQQSVTHPRGEGRGLDCDDSYHFPKLQDSLAAEPAWAGKSGAWPSQKARSDLRRVFWVLGLGLLGHWSLSVTFPLFSPESLASYQLPSSWLTIITYAHWIIYIHIWFFYSVRRRWSTSSSSSHFAEENPEDRDMVSHWS